MAQWRDWHITDAECIHDGVGKVKIETVENPFEKKTYDLIVAINLDITFLFMTAVSNMDSVYHRRCMNTLSFKIKVNKLEIFEMQALHE